MFVLTVIRVPIAFAMGIVGFLRPRAMRGWNPALASAGDADVRDRLLVHPVGGAAVHPDGQLRQSRRLVAASCSARPTPSSATGAAGWRCRPSWPAPASARSAARPSPPRRRCRKVAYPSMKRYGYSDALATGSIAAGGTLGILIPPSVIMVIYSLMTETNIGEMFAAGVVPGLVATVLLMVAVAWQTWRDPAAGPARRAHALAGTLARPARDLGRGGAVRAGDGRHLRRRLHRDRGRVDRRVRRLPVRACAPLAHLGGAGPGARRERPDHGDAVHDPDRCADLRQLRQLHVDAGRPEGLRASSSSSIR